MSVVKTSKKQVQRATAHAELYREHVTIYTHSKFQVITCAVVAELGVCCVVQHLRKHLSFVQLCDFEVRVLLNLHCDSLLNH